MLLPIVATIGIIASITAFSNKEPLRDMSILIVYISIIILIAKS